ncbi:hypothetical protein EJB05_40273, partial [Eragrostis curvula]
MTTRPTQTKKRKKVRAGDQSYKEGRSQVHSKKHVHHKDDAGSELNTNVELVVGDARDDAGAVGPEAGVAADLSGGAPDVAHLDHGPGELVEEGSLVCGEGVDDVSGAGVVGEALVGGEHALPVPQVDVVPVVEGHGRDDVQVLLPVGCGGALPGEAPGEVVVGPDEAAAGFTDGVPAGERHQVRRVAEPAAAEDAQERVHGRGWAREDADLVRRRGPQAVLAAQGQPVERPAGEVDGVARGEGEDVGAGDGGAACGVDTDADVLDELLRPRLQRPVGPETALRVQEDGPVAALREAVVEEDAEEPRRDLHVAAERVLHGSAHHARQLRARPLMEVRRQRRHNFIITFLLHVRQRQRLCRRRADGEQADHHGQAS